MCVWGVRVCVCVCVCVCFYIGIICQSWNETIHCTIGIICQSWNETIKCTIGIIYVKTETKQWIVLTYDSNSTMYCFVSALTYDSNSIQLFNGCGCNRPIYLSWGAGNDQVFYCMRPMAECNRTLGHSQHRRTNSLVYCIHTH
jgi:hypothetical protein